jgi:arylsulfatase A
MKLSLCMFAIAGLMIMGRQSRAAPLPNIVIILADDMGYGDTSINGGWIKTPNLDRMAAEGLRFTDFHASGNVCSPTRAGLMTGRYQQRAGISQVVKAESSNPTHFEGLQSVEVTLPELLKTAGYTTAMVGKWHLGYFPRYNPVLHGFDQFRGYLSGNIDYQSHVDNQGRPDWWNGLTLAPEAGYSTHLITQHADEFLRRPHPKSFFLYVAHEAVHDPLQGPEDPPQRASGETNAKRPTRPVKEIYRDMMTELDRGVGILMATLRETGQAENTLVFFFSDNGATKQGSNGSLRGFKGSDWEGGHREPAIAWWPSHIKPGVTDQLSISLDLMPTLLALAGVAQPTDRKLDGMSMLPLLLHGVSLGQRQLYWNGDAMRDGPWKLMTEKKQPPQLFNLAEDLGEQKDLAAKYPERLKNMVAALERWRTDVATGATPQPKSEAEIK